jgi:hypothetical protein
MPVRLARIMVGQASSGWVRLGSVGCGLAGKASLGGARMGMAGHVLVRAADHLVAGYIRSMSERQSAMRSDGTAGSKALMIS